jgi:anti-sigma regulatory factor (Ser/Thr protein kinase)
MTTEETKIADAELRLTLPGAAANVAIVRQATTGALGVLGLGETRVLDINAAVSEACNNVVVHAYPGAAGLMEVELAIGATEVEVTVSDHGVGITPNRPEPELGVQGLGLSLIQTLTDRVEFLGGVGQGTTVRMGFSLDGAGSAAATVDERRNGGSRVSAPPGEVMVAVSAGPLAAPVLGRIVAMLAARVGFSLEGVSEAQLVTDSIAAHAPDASIGSRVQLGFDAPDRELVISVGPLDHGGAERILASSGKGDLPPVLERLTRERRVEPRGEEELLRLSLVNPD